MDSAYQQAIQMFQQAANNLGMGGQLTAFLTPQQNQMQPGQPQPMQQNFDMPVSSGYQQMLADILSQKRPDVATFNPAQMDLTQGLQASYPQNNEAQQQDQQAQQQQQQGGQSWI